MLLHLFAALAAGPQDTSEVHESFAKNTLILRNDKAIPVTVVVDLAKGSNVRMVPAQPHEVVLAPGQATIVEFASAGGAFSYRYTWGWEPGSSAATHTPDGPYLLPWPATSSFECTQSFDEIYSHRHEHALDVKMPVGTPILAARAGKVIEVVDGWGEGGPDRALIDQANRVRILHQDGTIADYLHLDAGGMRVALGDAVKRGQRIATSGHSGFSQYPHLHFAVESPLDGWMSRTWPVRFEVDGTSIVLRTGNSYP